MRVIIERRRQVGVKDMSDHFGMVDLATTLTFGGSTMWGSCTTHQHPQKMYTIDMITSTKIKIHTRN